MWYFNFNERVIMDVFIYSSHGPNAGLASLC